MRPMPAAETLADEWATTPLVPKSRTRYDGMSVVLPDAPMPDEIAVIFCIANRSRVQCPGRRADA